MIFMKKTQPVIAIFLIISHYIAYLFRQLLFLYCILITYVFLKLIIYSITFKINPCLFSKIKVVEYIVVGRAVSLIIICFTLFDHFIQLFFFFSPVQYKKLIIQLNIGF